MVSFRGSDDPLGMEQVVCVRAFLDCRIATVNALDFTVRVDKVALQDRKVRISCGDTRSHAWVKAQLNESDGDFVARSLDELPPLRKLWFRMYKQYDVSLTHTLLQRCNVNFPEGKLHIRSVIPDGNGKTIIVGAEPMMVKYLEERKFRLNCGSTVIELREGRRAVKGRKTPVLQAQPANPKAAQANTGEVNSPQVRTRAAEGTSSSLQSTSPSLPPPTLSSPEIAEAGAAEAVSQAVPAKAAEGTPLPPSCPGVAGPSSDGQATPTPLAVLGRSTSPMAGLGYRGKGQKGKKSSQAKPAGRGKGGSRRGAPSTRGKQKR